MRTDAARIAIAFFALVFGGAAECLLPRFFGVGLPFLLAASLAVAERRPLSRMVLFALAAGAAEDSLSGLPFATSAAFFVLAAAAVKRSGAHLAVASLAYPVYQLWLWLWTAPPGGVVFGRFLAAVPAGLVTALAVPPVLVFLERKAALDGR